MNDGGWSLTEGPIPERCPVPIGGGVPVRLAHNITLSLTTLRRDASLAFGVREDEALDLPRAACTKRFAIHVEDEEVGTSGAQREQGAKHWQVARGSSTSLSPVSHPYKGNSKISPSLSRG